MLTRVLAEFRCCACARRLQHSGVGQAGTGRCGRTGCRGGPATGVRQAPDGGALVSNSGQPSTSGCGTSTSRAGPGAQCRADDDRRAFAKIIQQDGRATRADGCATSAAGRIVFVSVDERNRLMYRYFVHGGFYAAMFVYFDPAGVVKRTETGMDPGASRR